MESLDQRFTKNLHPKIKSILDHSKDYLKGEKDHLFKALCCFFSSGHLLIEDVPGVGKTTMVKYLGKVLGLELSRIQFTNDLLPTDIIGSSVFSKTDEKFHFIPGPLFGEIVLADELNRATPKTQSALLQSMEERKINADGQEHKLPDDYFVVATQNPHGQMGTFPLPESQIDRFMMKLSLGYLNEEESIELFEGGNPAQAIESLSNLISKTEIIEIKSSIEKTHCSKSLLSYIYRLLEASRFQNGMIPLSTRCGMDLTAISKTIAFFYGRDYVMPEDVQEVFVFIAGHRLAINQSGGRDYELSLAKKILDEVSIRET